MQSATAKCSRATGWAMLLGFALGGFFDGILLHQILEWHHLLSLVRGVTSLRTQLMWDGYFHALMYVLAVVALVGLWRGRADPHRRMMGPALLLGFALWHGVDAVLFHWVLEIHRVRLGAPFPLAWDLGWLATFGAVPLIIALIWSRRKVGPVDDRTSDLQPFLILAGVTGALAFWSLQSPPGQRFTTRVRGGDEPSPCV